MTCAAIAGLVASEPVSAETEQPAAVGSARHRRNGPAAQHRRQGVSEIDLVQTAARVKTVVAGVLGTEVADEQPLMEAGLDSLGEKNGMDETRGHLVAVQGPA